jgi:hypothetical protein
MLRRMLDPVSRIPSAHDQNAGEADKANPRSARKPFVRPVFRILVALAGAAIILPAQVLSQTLDPHVHFVPNTFQFWNNPMFATTELPPGCTGSGCTPTPAYANIVLHGSNFVECRGGPFALCYYSGPSDGSVDLSCTFTPDGKFANCNCYEIPYGKYFVDINAILNYGVYLRTVAVCGKDGSGCLGQPNKAPVCGDINNQKFIPGADLVSTFSFDCVPTDGIGQTPCTQAQPYAGCMTSPCYRTQGSAATGIVQCSCPVFDGPYQIGQFNQQCTLGDDLVWSAAFAPGASGTAPTLSAGQCFPDAPGSLGCPLLAGPPPFQPPAGIDCQRVCQEYTSCSNSAGIQAGFTCDATLCTGQCDDRDLISQACSGLTSNGQGASACDISEIAKTEAAAGCSCCASQLCGCQANTQTEQAIFALDAAQRTRGITPQCDDNGTLCGTPP